MWFGVEVEEEHMAGVTVQFCGTLRGGGSRMPLEMQVPRWCSFPGG